VILWLYFNLGFLGNISDSGSDSDSDSLFISDFISNILEGKGFMLSGKKGFGFRSNSGEYVFKTTRGTASTTSEFVLLE
jgi:hypothetical protein